MKRLDNTKPSSPLQDFRILGVEDTAYIKPVTIRGQQLFAIHAADGTQLTTVTDRELAFATVRQHDMEPVSVH